MQNVLSNRDTNTVGLRRTVSMKYLIDTCLWYVHKSYLQTFFFPNNLTFSSNKKSSHSLPLQDIITTHGLLTTGISAEPSQFVRQSAHLGTLAARRTRYLVTLGDRSPFSCLSAVGMLFVFTFNKFSPVFLWFFHIQDPISFWKLHARSG
jgi:hypothetical protein